MTTDLDRKLQQQLDRCRVPHYTEPFEFKHGHSYYWIVKGLVPLAVAQEIYRDPAANDIRVAGHCGCPPPEDPWITWRMPDGTMLATMKDKAELDHLEDVIFANDKNHVDSRLQYTFTDDPHTRSKARGYIETYHIDSELGLRVFVDYLRWNGLLR